MGTEQIYRTLPPIVHTVGMRPIELIGKFFHKLILYLLFKFFCLLLSSLQKTQEICQADKYGCKQQIDIKAFSLDEITEAVASLVVLIKIHPVVLNHGIAHDQGENQKKQCHEKNGLFFFRESLNYIFHGANIGFFFQKRCLLPPLRCLLPTK